jgi:RimJ/RimL family protein N-acetyltransferase
VSYTIEEDYQGQGLATMFMAMLTEIAREHGIARFEAEVLVGNQAMLGVFRKSGLPLHRHTEEGVVCVVMDLEAIAGAAGSAA